MRTHAQQHPQDTGTAPTHHWFRVERLNARTGEWRTISGAGINGLDACWTRFDGEAEVLKRGTIRLVDNHGAVVRELTR